MKKEYSFGVTLAITLVFGFLYSYTISKIFNVYEPSDLVVTISVLLFWVLIWEFITRMIPSKYQPPSVFLTSLNIKDKVVFLLSGVLFAIVYSRLSETKYSLPLTTQLIYSVIGLLVCIAPILLFGSKELKHNLFGKKK